MQRALILDACQRSALSVTRSLGKHNVPIITADSAFDALAGNSRYSSDYFQYPPPETHPDQFVEFILILTQDQNIQIIFPMTELTTTLLLENKSKFKHVILPFSDLDTVNAISDKSRLMKAAKTLDIPIPKTLHKETLSGIQSELDNLTYPLVLKPGISWLKHNNKWFRSLVQFADNPETAYKIVTEDCAFSIHPFMLQECVQGIGKGVFALYDHGKAVAFFNHNRIREKPYWGGVSVLSESVAVDPDLLNYSMKLLDSVKWHGIAMVEFKVSKNGSPYLMEINTRFWGSLQLAVDAGVDFPWLLYQISTERTVDEVKGFKKGIRLRWLLGDIDSLYISLKSKKLSIRKKITAIIQFLKPAPFKTRHEVNRLGDIGPFYWELKQYIRDLFAK